MWFLTSRNIDLLHGIVQEEVDVWMAFYEDMLRSNLDQLMGYDTMNFFFFISTFFLIRFQNVLSTNTFLNAILGLAFG